MQLPMPLRAAIEAAARHYSVNDLKRAALALSQRYQSQSLASQMGPPVKGEVGGETSGLPFVQNEIERCAYAITRMPATYAAARWCLSELRRRWPDGQFERWLDLGAGTGAASWAAAEAFPSLQQGTLLEQDAGLLRWGQLLAQSAAPRALGEAQWQRVLLQEVADWPPHDLAIASYALGEMVPELAARVVRAVWQVTEKALVVIEPGTMRGFATVRRLRDHLIGQGAYLVAPCPHTQACPLPAHDWCHFAARVERSALQRQLKGGSLGHEDEKFAYLIVAKQPLPPVTARVLRHPQRQPGQTELQLCTSTGLQTRTIKKRDATWRQARKIDWGEAWENDDGKR